MKFLFFYKTLLWECWVNCSNRLTCCMLKFNFAKVNSQKITFTQLTFFTSSVLSMILKRILTYDERILLICLFYKWFLTQSIVKSINVTQIENLMHYFLSFDTFDKKWNMKWHIDRIQISKQNDVTIFAFDEN